MPRAPLPADEEARLAALARYEVMDTAHEAAFDDLAALAAHICDVPIALISLVDAKRQWFKACIGLDVAETPRDQAFCAHAILDKGSVLHVEDATRDPRFADNPLVIGDPSIRFYAGAPIEASDGYPLGTICAIDRRARKLDEKQVEALQRLGRLVSRMLDHRLLARKEVERERQADRDEIERLGAVTTQELDLKVLIDRDLVYRFVNDAYLKYWGRKRDEVVGKRLSDLHAADLLEQYDISGRIRRAFAGEAATFRSTVAYPQVGVRHMDVALLPAYGMHGEVIGALFRSHDVTELVETTAELSVAAEKLRGHVEAQERFIHMLSHDLREPINTIVNFASALDEHLSDAPDEARDFLSRVLAGGERMKLLLDDLVRMLRLRHREWEGTPVALDGVLEEVVVDIGDAIGRSGASIQIAALPPVAGERSLLKLLFQNLVLNAIKFSKPGSPPRVRVGQVDGVGGVEIFVADDGIGIPPESLERIFDEFYRVHPRKKYDGTGLGLSICHRIVELHGGRIWATSAAGEGACLHVAFPAVMS